jgi:hypothetical protein
VLALLGALGTLQPDVPQLPVLGSLAKLTELSGSSSAVARSGTANTAGIVGGAAGITNSGPAAAAAVTCPGEEPRSIRPSAEVPGLIGERLHRRYLRICAVQDELGKLDFTKTKPGAALKDLVFDQADFSVYKKISAENFALFSGPGLDDFGPPFFAKAFALDREKVGSLINNAYQRIGAFYYIKQEKLLFNPLLMAVMRTLHTSLEFAPVFTGEEIRTECTALLHYLMGKNIVEKEILPFLPQIKLIFFRLLEALDGVSLEHPDGMKTELSAVRAADTRITLKGTFHPRGKAYTIPLVYHHLLSAPKT